MTAASTTVRARLGRLLDELGLCASETMSGWPILALLDQVELLVGEVGGGDLELLAQHRLAVAEPQLIGSLANRARTVVLAAVIGLLVGVIVTFVCAGARRGVPVRSRAAAALALAAALAAGCGGGGDDAAQRAAAGHGPGPRPRRGRPWR